MVGHSWTSTTKDLDGHVIPEDRSAASDAIGRHSRLKRPWLAVTGVVFPITASGGRCGSTSKRRWRPSTRTVWRDGRHVSEAPVRTARYGARVPVPDGDNRSVTFTWNTTKLATSSRRATARTMPKVLCTSGPPPLLLFSIDSTTSRLTGGELVVGAGGHPGEGPLLPWGAWALRCIGTDRLCSLGCGQGRWSWAEMGPGVRPAAPPQKASTGVRSDPLGDRGPQPVYQYFLVEVSGFEPPTPAVRRQCSTGLSYTPEMRGKA